jgi:L-fuculokinase
MEEFSNSRDKVAVIAVFDIGKTNKKLFLFDEDYNVVHQQSQQLQETRDEDGFPCEDIHLLTRWVKDSFSALRNQTNFEIKAVSVSAYGASLVHLDNQHNVIGHLTNYLKPYPEELLQTFLSENNTDNDLLAQVASPLLGNLNSGLQLYRLKYEKPSFYNQIKYSLHLPQYISSLLHRKLHSEFTSLGCHTMLWDFEKNNYHSWVLKENIDLKFPETIHASRVELIGGNHRIKVGVGLHDSSSALIPYMKSIKDPFVLISTGTWCISLNPFNHKPLTKEELESDCLQYLSYEGKPVKASRIFAGHEHDLMIKKLADRFNVDPDYHVALVFDRKLSTTLTNGNSPFQSNIKGLQHSGFDNRDVSQFHSFEEAYHQLVYDIVQLQILSTGLVLNGTKTDTVFVDGGFSNNPIYMNLLSANLPGCKIYSTSMSQTSALGAALAIHNHWNKRPIPGEIVGPRLFNQWQ